MDSPFPPSSSAPGDGRIIAARLPSGVSGIETMTYQYPLKLISPAPAPHQPSALVFLLSYGGGLVGGDCVNLSIQVKKDSNLSIATQGHTKIFKSPSADVVTRQNLLVHIDNGAGLCLLPDPVQPFESSVYAQKQIFKLECQASLCLLDWVTQGRSARGESWDFIKWSGRNEIWLNGSGGMDESRLLVRDSVSLSQEDSNEVGMPLKEIMHQMGLSGTLILRGSMVKSLGGFFLDEFHKLPRIGAQDFQTPASQSESAPKPSETDKWRSERLLKEKSQGILWSAAQVRGCVVVKFGARTVEAGREWIGTMLVEEGSIAARFGDQALMCIK